MAPKKKTAPNAFMIFTFEWKEKYGRHMGMAAATTEAGKIWQDMDAQQRGPYHEKARQSRTKANNHVEKLTCTGKPVAFVEKEKQELENRERQMKRYIENTVRNSVKQNRLEHQSYYFIMVNYFTKTLNGGVYVPAEISASKYSLKDGVCRKYHTFVNPGVNIYGHQYEAQHHSESTHKLPLPPKAKGETNLARIYNDILEFIYDEEAKEYPPLYTNRDTIPIVESVLDFLKSDLGASNIDLKVYSIQHLFYIMKEATCEMGEIVKPTSFYITDAYFERDFFEYQSGIACTYHEEIDKSKYCTQSCVTRWGFMFSDYMCRDIAITLIPGRHVPETTNINAITNPAPSSVFDDTESFVSMNTEASKALTETKIYYDDCKSQSSKTRPNYANVVKKHSASAGSPQYTKQTKLTKNYEADEDPDDIADDLNPWASRSRRVPREPDASDFDIEYSTSKLDDYHSTVHYSGRGRALLNHSLNTTHNASTSAAGRGRNSRNFN